MLDMRRPAGQISELADRRFFPAERQPVTKDVKKVKVRRVDVRLWGHESRFAIESCAAIESNRSKATQHLDGNLFPIITRRKCEARHVKLWTMTVIHDADLEHEPIRDATRDHVPGLHLSASGTQWPAASAR